MIVHFTARQMDLTPEIKAYCEKRLQALEPLLGSVSEVDVILSAEKHRHKAEIHVKAKIVAMLSIQEYCLSADRMPKGMPTSSEMAMAVVISRTVGPTRLRMRRATGILVMPEYPR